MYFVNSYLSQHMCTYLHLQQVRLYFFPRKYELDTAERNRFIL